MDSGKVFMSGYPDQSYGPKKNATRAEVCAIVSRYLNRAGNEWDWLSVWRCFKYSAILINI
ncbi:MAG: S-layer homology domain-containing protein [Peptococcaceae bacterium MAG4]|nr:S-layer homology domain-containing protein [Peptococcaceae bacterium MAG4]